MSAQSTPFRVIDGGRAGEPPDERMNAAWQRYLDARRKAESSLDMRDGVAAGKAWADFIALFDRRPA